MVLCPEAKDGEETEPTKSNVVWNIGEQSVGKNCIYSFKRYGAILRSSQYLIQWVALVTCRPLGRLRSHGIVKFIPLKSVLSYIQMKFPHTYVCVSSRIIVWLRTGVVALPEVLNKGLKLQLPHCVSTAKITWPYLKYLIRD